MWLKIYFFCFSFLGFYFHFFLGANLLTGVCYLLTLGTAAAPRIFHLFCPLIKVTACSFFFISGLLSLSLLLPWSSVHLHPEAMGTSLHLRDELIRHGEESGWFHSQALISQGSKETRTLCIYLPTHIFIF